MSINEKYLKKIDFSKNALIKFILKIAMAISTKAKLPRISENQCAPIITLLKATNSAIKIKKEKEVRERCCVNILNNFSSLASSPSVNYLLILYELY